MPRSQASVADEQLSAYAAKAGVDASTRQIERWREHGLVPRNLKRSLGRGKGSTSEPAPGAAELVIWLAQHARPGRRPKDLALLAFGQGLAVPEPTVRKAFAAVVDDMSAAVEKHASRPMDAGKETAVPAPVNLVPARIRRVDRALGAVIDFADPGVSALDAGFGSEGLTPAEFGRIGILAVQEGADSIDLGTMAAMGRSLLPAGTAAPLAGLLEFTTPTATLSDGSPLANDEGGLAFLPTGDLRGYFRGLAADTPLDELVDVWQLEVQLRAWAIDLCERVEREIAVDRLGAAAQEWMRMLLGLGRSWLVTSMRDKNRPVDIAASTLMLVFTRDMLRLLRQNVVDGRFELLTHPVGLPPGLVSLLDQ